MKKTLCFILYFGLLLSLKAQTLSLEECQELARENYPAIRQKAFIDQTSQFTISNARHNWLPQVSVAAQATYQSDVITFPDEVNNLFEMMGMEFEGLRKDQYKAAIQVEQVIWGGGAVKARVEMARAENEANLHGWEVEMYTLRERINQLYFGTLLLQEKIREADLLIEELNRNLKLVQSYVENGIAGKNDLDQLRVELLSAGQQKSELTANREAYIMMLGIMINRELTGNTDLVKPELSTENPDLPNNRPELKYFEAQAQMINATRRAINAQIKPQIGAFFQGAYANPGLDLFENMQKNQWSPYFITGVKFSWNIAGFYNRKNQLSQLDLNRSQLSLQRETFLYNTNLQSTRMRTAIRNMQEVMREDDEIIDLRTTIRKRTESGVENGTMSVSDLLRDINAEKLARQNKITREIELLKNIYDLKYTTNN